MSSNSSEYAASLRGSRGLKFISGNPHLNCPRVLSMKFKKVDPKSHCAELSRTKFIYC